MSVSVVGQGETSTKIVHLLQCPFFRTPGAHECIQLNHFQGRAFTILRGVVKRGRYLYRREESEKDAWKAVCIFAKKDSAVGARSAVRMVARVE